MMHIQPQVRSADVLLNSFTKSAAISPMSIRSANCGRIACITSIPISPARSLHISLVRSFQGRLFSTLSEHLAPNHSQFQDSQPDALVAWAETMGQETLRYVKDNLARRRDFATGMKAVIGLKRDVRKGEISPSRLESACAYANSLPGSSNSSPSPIEKGKSGGGVANE